MGFINKCIGNTINSLFPSNIENKSKVLIINLLHIIGIIILQFGVLLPPKYMKYYITYIVVLMLSYIILNNRCFMTELSNYYSGVNYNVLCIKMKNAKVLLFIYLLIAVIFDSYPQYSFYNLIKMVLIKIISK